MSTFDIDFSKLILWLLPHFLRRRRLFSFIGCLCFPVIKLYDEFILFRSETIYKLDHTGQVFSLENVLNDRFDTVSRRIFITDAYTKQRKYIYARVEVKPKFLGFIYLHNRADYADTGVDFIVWIPGSVYVSEEDMYEVRALLNFYKLAGKRYKIYRS